MTTPRLCSVAGCTRKHSAKGLCKMHYYRQRDGRPLEAPLRVKHGPVCAATGCESASCSAGLCSMHYQRSLKGAPLDAPRRGAVQRVCAVEGCERPHCSGGLCKKHYYRAKASGDPLRTASGRAPRGTAPKVCTVEGCDKKTAARGLCAMHYQRQAAHGELGSAASTKAPHGSGYVDERGYRIVYRDGAQVAEHRYVMAQQLGRPLLPGETVHHRNGQRADNRAENLHLMESSHPAGQFVEDKVAWAKELLALYEPEALAARVVDFVSHP